jgi:hypothetical protein
MPNVPSTLSDLLESEPTAGWRGNDPFTPAVGGDPETEASDLAAAFGIENSHPLGALLHSISFPSFALTPQELHHTMSHKVRGVEQCISLKLVFDAARECMRPDREFEAPLLGLQLLDLYGPVEARRLTATLRSLADEITLRDFPLRLEDPFTLDFLTEALLHCLHDEKPDATREDGFRFVREALLERWPATEPSVRASFERILRMPRFARQPLD